MNSAYITLNEASASKCPMLFGTVNYLKNFLGKPHPSLESAGHKGSVCPFTPQVLKSETVSFARETINVNDPDAIEKIKWSLESYKFGFFNVVEARLEKSKQKLACLLIVIQGLNSADECNKFVSLVQKDLQPSFVEVGLLLSELHPYNQVPSVRNSEFFASQPPFPIFFIRRVIPNDIPYLLRKDRYNNEVYKKILMSLKRNFGVELIIAEMKRLGKEIDLTIKPTCRFKGGSCDCRTISSLQGFGFIAWNDIYRQCDEDNKLHFEESTPFRIFGNLD